MSGCPDCYPTPGLRELALGWRDNTGTEHRRVWMACCTCDAGSQLIEATGAKAVEGGNCPRVTWKFVLETWRAMLPRRFATEVGWWVTSRDLRRLPVEATTTPAELARMAEERQAMAARKAQRAAVAERRRRGEGLTPADGIGAPEPGVVAPVADLREEWNGAADGDPGPWGVYG